tara:strand:+ start:1587 stop:3293 length:1707 start_codon:yes stop_codon:yes gene_type:complete
MAVKKQTGTDIKLITLSNYVRPQVIENKSRNWVLNGRNNSFYDYIIDRQNGSVTNSSVNNSYTDLIYGKGLGYTNGIRGVQDWASLQTILRPKELRKIISDFQIFGEFSFQVIKTRGGGLSSIEHLGKQNVVPSIANEDGEIESYYFSRNWAKVQQNTPEEFSAFGTSNDAIEIYVGKPYQVGRTYFSDPSYLAALPYCEFEEELANLNINSIKNGLSAGYIINIPDGINFTPEQKEEFERNVKSKLTGSPNASNFILSFNGRDVEITITSFPVNDNIHKQWQWLSDSARQNILTGHRCTSPSIVGVISSSGFSNTADEMEQARIDLTKFVIKPKQDFILEALEDVLLQYDISLDLIFKPLTEVVKPTEEVSMNTQLSNDAPNVDSLIQLGESFNEDEYDVVESERCDVITLHERELNTLVQLASVPVTPRKNSDQDTSLFKVRYQYAGSESGQREFCNKIIRADKLYREEDLNFSSVYNEDFSPKGKSSYNVFLYKGGVNCKHFWKRTILLKKNNNQIGVNQARKMILSLDPQERKDAMWELNDPKVAQSANPFNNWWSLDPTYRKL